MFYIDACKAPRSEDAMTTSTHQQNRPTPQAKGQQEENKTSARRSNQHNHPRQPHASEATNQQPTEKAQQTWPQGTLPTLPELVTQATPGRPHTNRERKGEEAQKTKEAQRSNTPEGGSETKPEKRNLNESKTRKERRRKPTNKETCASE